MPTPRPLPTRLLVTLSLLLSANSLQALEIYRTPVSPAPQPGDEAKDCQALEREIATLTPYTDSFKPGFFHDPYHGASLTLGTTVSWPAYSVLGYSLFVDYRERERIFRTQERIETLRALKAEKHCFED